ncbi:hypothetical protein ACYFX5_01725 [Bremerella sp. T1]|uniref:hypothetical protein n=1 Tax=Bremerella sp. TYQ1 TaxID=3119568 RepID=UPI001CCCF4F8|nr:hypothetical protein [Bremerella volcania]UBM37001.1 hypothetical protein LA756_03675 [Bremerella volcania]
MSDEPIEEIINDPTQVQNEVKRRLGVLPHFFRLGPEAPEITENLWGFAKFGYLDNPLPPLLKERLFVYLSRFCKVHYCLARHVGFLIGLGRPSGSVRCEPETIDQVIHLLELDLPCGQLLVPFLDELQNTPTALFPLPKSGSNSEEMLFACAAHIFLQTSQASTSLQALSSAMDRAEFQHLLVFLAFVRTAHFWSEVHPELEIEEDLKTLLKVHEKLAECIQRKPQFIAVESVGTCGK